MEKSNFKLKTELIENQFVLEKEYLTLKEACLYLSISESTMYKMTCRKEIRHYKPKGKNIYFKKEELSNWISNCQVKTINEIIEENEVRLSKKRNA